MQSDVVTDLGLQGLTRTVIFDMRDLDSPVHSADHIAVDTAIDHNIYTKGDRGYLSNYCAGLRVLDVSAISTGSTPEIGYFDVAPDCSTATFAGTWSNYPYFASNTIAVSSIERGLFLVRESAATTPYTDPPTYVSFPGNFVADASFEQAAPGARPTRWVRSLGSVAGWTGVGSGYTITNNSAEVRSGVSAAKLSTSSSAGIAQTVDMDASEGTWPTELRVRGCSYPVLIPPGCGAGCDGYAMVVDATFADGGSVAGLVARFDPDAGGYHCVELRVSSPAGVLQLQLTATLDLDLHAETVASAVFDDFDVTVTAPYCWGELEYCRGVRTRFGPPAADPCIFTAAEADMGRCIKDTVDDAHWTRGFGMSEAAALDAAIQAMLSLTDAAGCTGDSLPAQLRPKFDLRSRTIDARSCCVLAESGTYRPSGAGIVIVRIGTPDQYRPVYVHATHPRTDTNTEVQSLELFRQAATHSVVIAGARRDAGSAASTCQSSYGASDAAHNTDSITWVASRAVASHYANSPARSNTPWTVLEPHGMAASTCPGVDIFLTAGNDVASDGDGALARLGGFRDGLAAALAGVTVTTPAGDGSGCALLGSHNTAGRLLNGVDDRYVCDTAANVVDIQSRFMHLEQKFELRNTASSITAIASAINATWSLGTMPTASPLTPRPSGSPSGSPTTVAAFNAARGVGAGSDRPDSDDEYGNVDISFDRFPAHFSAPTPPRTRCVLRSTSCPC